MGAVRAMTRKRLLWVGVFAVLLVAVAAAPGFADSPEPSPSGAEGEAAAASGGPTFETVENDENAATPDGGSPDTEAAALLPHQDLDREEAVDLLEAAFSEELQAPAGPFDELKVAKYLADNVALIAAGQQPDEEGADESAYHGATLLDSTVPLRTEGPNGAAETVELSLEHDDGELQPANSLVEVGIPQNLGSGLALPESQVQIRFDGMAPSVSPSTIAKSVAFYPNVSTDTDVAIAPSPTGVETFSVVRSEHGDLSQRLDFEMPAEMSLVKTEQGGAEVRDGSSVELSVSPPTATDAAGESVPVDLNVQSHALELTITPNSSTQFPILVDPMIQSYNWVEHPREGINGNTYGEQWTATSWGGSLETHWGNEVPEPTVHANLKPGKTGDFAAWQYTVPRYYQDTLYYPNIAPTSFITHMTLSNLHWWAGSEQLSPYLKAGLWDTSKKEWVSVVSKEGLKEHGLSDLTHVYPFDNEHTNTNVKIASIGEMMMEDVSSYDPAVIEVGSATVELGEASTDIPAIGSVGIPAHWVDQTPEEFPFSIEDTGLGVYSITLSNEGNSWKTPYGCVGVSGNACPRVWSVPYSTKLPKYEPGVLPTGVDTLKVVAEDPLGHVSKATTTQVKVDHVPPVVSVGGTATEQEVLGTKLPSYGVKVTATDGTEVSPQSGVAKAAIELDGAIVKEISPGCSTRNCSASLEWTLEAAKYAAGTHTIKAVVTDAVGRTTTKSNQVEIHSASPPTLSLAGSMTEQASLGISRPRYTLKANASALAGRDGSSPYEIAYSGSFGSGPNSGNGQFNHPADVVTDAQGNRWVADKTNNRVEEFNEKGEFIKAIGSLGSTGGKLNAPSGVAIDSYGDIDVTDTGNNRLARFHEDGTFDSVVGANVNKTKVESKGTLAEKNHCTASSGNVCQAGTAGSTEGLMSEPIGITTSGGGNFFVVEKANNRVEKFNTNGELLAKFGSSGSGEGQFKEPTAMITAPNGDGFLWVADTGNNRIEEFNSSYVFVRAVGGKEGSGNGEFKAPDAIGADAIGDVYVADRGNSRVEEFNEKGAYLAKFGSAGTGPGQFSFSDPAGIVVTGKGEILIADSGNNRVQTWISPKLPTYSAAFGAAGTAAGQFNHPADVAIDAQGNLWTVDNANNRIEEFTESGGSPKAFGSLGSTGGKLSSPSGIAGDSSGNIWVTDTGNTRVEEFNGKGEFVATFGTNVNKTKVEAAGTQAEKNLCTAASKNVCQAGSAGSAEGQMKEPIGIAASSGGNIYVVEKGNSRVEKFSPTGAILANFGGPGAGTGQFKEPTAIAVAPDASLWVADSGNNRIQHWNSTFTSVTMYGKEGSTNGEFKHPDAIETDPFGNAFVADQGNGRVQEFSENGVFLTSFGSSGTGTGQFSLTDPAGIAVNAKGEIWVTDTGDNRIEKWTQQILRSEISTKITVDGKQVSTSKAACAGESCPLYSEWILESSKYSAGKHLIEVEATDSLGRTTTKALSIEIQPDTTPPTVEASGALFNAPSGWVEQESYGLTASASDAGAGVTSMELKIDGKTVASQAQACTEGGCKESFSKSISMASYAGGAHAAELVATDGLGHSASKHWTLNVDPEGHVSATEAEETLEAADATSESGVVASGEEAISAEERADGNDPSLVGSGSTLESEGVPDLSTISQDPKGGFTVTTPGVSLEVEPRSTSAGATEMAIAAETAAVAGNTGTNTDSVLRPNFNGVTAFQSIRDVTAPETFSWNVKLYEGQKLKAVDSKDAEVDFEDGTEAFLISAELAHDAVGKEVPTILSVSEGHVITLKVEHREAQYVYPVVAGAGWEGGFSTQIVETPKDDYELRLEREQREQEELNRKLAEIEEAEQAALGNPEDEPAEGDEVKNTSPYRPVKGTVYTGPPVMIDAVHRVRRSKAEANYCSSLSCGTWNSWEVGTWFWNGKEHVAGGYAERGDTTLHCYGTAHPVVDNNVHKVGWSGPNPAPYGYGAHLNLWCNFDIFYFDLQFTSDTYYNMQDHLYGDGYQKQHIKEYEPSTLEG